MPRRLSLEKQPHATLLSDFGKAMFRQRNVSESPVPELGVEGALREEIPRRHLLPHYGDIRGWRAAAVLLGGYSVMP